MNLLQEISVTQESVNDDYVTIVQLHFNNNDYVKAGDTVIDLETSKAVMSIEAESDGYIQYYCSEGDDVAIGRVIIRIFDSMCDEGTDGGGETRLDTGEGNRSVDGDDIGPQFSRSAIEYIEHNRIDKTLFNGMDMVTLHDVLDITRRSEGSGNMAAGVHEAPMEPEQIGGRLDPEGFARLQQDAAGFARLDSGTKIERYREWGAKIGKNVVIGRGSLIIAERIEIEDDVVLEDNCYIRCESVHLGELGFYRSGFNCTCRSIYIGKEAFVARHVIVGRGGSGEPTAVLKIGDRVFIGERCLLNTCLPITVEDECFIGQNTAIMTHNIGLSYLDGYENAFAPVRIGNRVQIGINCVLYPNSDIGSGSIVASNSYVIGKIPKEKLVMGIPARAVKDSHKKVSGKERKRRFSQLVQRFTGLLKVRDMDVREETTPSGTVVRFDYAGTLQTVLFCDRFETKQTLSLSGPLVVVALEGGSAEHDGDTAHIDLKTLQVSGTPTAVTDGLREFFRKAGIKLSPWPWRYKGGIL